MAPYWREKSMNADDYKTILGVALLAARAAGDAILEVYERDFGVDHKEDGSPLTLADRRSHEIITDCLTRGCSPVLPVLSEEGRDIPLVERRAWDYYWLVDPLDGTKEFIKRNGEFTVNIALIHRDRPVLGVVYLPVKQTFYFASEGLGAYRLEGREGVVDEGPPAGLIEASTPLAGGEDVACGGRGIRIVGSRSHVTSELEEFVARMKQRHGEVEFVPAGSSLKFCLVAEGAADMYPRFGPTMEWDTAAGQAVVEQAGGCVLDVETGERMLYNKESLLNSWFIASSTRSLLTGILR